MLKKKLYLWKVGMWTSRKLVSGGTANVSEYSQQSLPKTAIHTDTKLTLQSQQCQNAT